MDLSIIIVNYNTREFLRSCLRSIGGNPPALRYEIVVVDNDSHDGSAAMLQKEYPQVRLVRNNRNLGFSKASNRGAAVSSGDCLLFLNSDTEVQRDSLSRLVQFVHSRKNVGVVGPKIIDPAGQPTRSYMRFLEPQMLFLGSHRFEKLVKFQRHRMHYDSYDYRHCRAVPWLSGACILLLRDVFESAGGFDENYFLYMEDMDLSLRVHWLGCVNFYLPEAVVLHHFGKSERVENLIRNPHYRNSLLYYFRKNFSPLHFWLARFYLALASYRSQGADIRTSRSAGH